MPTITPASPPASAQLLLAIGPQGENGGVPGAESLFSALLDARIDAGLPGPGGETEAEPAPPRLPEQLQALLNVMLPGKVTGKILPDRPQLAAEAAADIAESPGLPGAAAMPAESEASPELTADAASPASPTGPADPALAPATAPALTAPPLEPIPAAPVPAQAAPKLHGKAPPAALPVQASAVAQAIRTQRTAPAPEAASAPEAGPLAVRVPPGLLLPTKFAEVPGQTGAGKQAMVPAPVPAQVAAQMPAQMPTLAITPQLRAEPGPASIAAGITPAVPTPQLTAALLVPFKLPVNAAPKIALVAQPEAAEPAAAASPLPVQLQGAGLPPAAPAPAILSPAALPQHRVQLARGEVREVASAWDRPARAASEDSGKTAAPLPLSVQPESLPLLAASQIASPTSFTAATGAPAAPLQHDFAALVDRLVEARQTAQASLGAQTVTAAITHAEFGQVSLQFRQDADGLSVVMASADPDLARAVQIAAPAAQSGMHTGTQPGTGNDGNSQQRPDSSGQQSANTGQLQTQTQAQSQQQRGQSAQQRSEDARGPANPSPRQRSQDDSSQRGGIFA